MRLFFQFRSWRPIAALLCLLSAAVMAEGLPYIQAGGAEARITSGIVVTGIDRGDFDEADPLVRAVIDLREKHHHALMALPDVVGTAVGLGDGETPAIVVFTRGTAQAGVIPDRIENTPVVALVTGEILAMPSNAAVNPSGYFPRPVPIGVSTGNIGQCLAGTISARVKDGAGSVYALSNNHVFALENLAPTGSLVVQPGVYDTGCKVNTGNAIGSLSAYVPIHFTPGTTNVVDCAIALSDTDRLGKGTPKGGYGMPASAVASAKIGQAVQKYGRTTSLATGAIQAINATINVSYSSGTATFVNQIAVYSPKSFIKAGDSGSLLVTNNTAANPVGLLFAGNRTGTYAFANPIGAVLSSFNVTVDGK